MQLVGWLISVAAAFAPTLAVAINNGALDPTFGTNGVVAIPGYSLAVQADGKIVALGAGTRQTSVFETGSFTLARLTSTGAIDFTRTDQVGSCSICGTQASTAATLVQPDGRILSVGTFFINHLGCFSPYFVATRHLASGDLDPTFGSSGVASVHFGTALALALQPDGKPVIAGAVVTGQQTIDQCGGLDQWPAHGLVRLDTQGGLDPAFGTGGSTIASLVPDDNVANAVAMLPDGRILTAGYALAAGNRDWALARFSATGALEASAVLDQGSADDVARAIALQPDGKFVVGGSAGAFFVLARFAAPGAYDPTFGSGGRVIAPGAAIVALVLQPDGKIVAAKADGDVLRFDANGGPDSGFGIGGRVSTGLTDVRSVALQADGRIVVGSTAGVARIDPALASAIGVDVSQLSFAAQSMHTTSPPQVVTLTNTSGTLQSIASITATAGFAVAHDCASLAPGTSCTASVTSTPVVAGAHSGDLVISGSGGTQKISLLGTGERSLVTHYYRSILRRAPDAGGKAFWESEAVRLPAAGASVNETWYAMAQSFYASAEYAALNRDDAGFVTDLYTTFANRAPDPGGLTFWSGQLASGMPREVVLAGFMFSAEFGNLTQAIFGNTPARRETDTVVDFYRGLLGRLPDQGGLTFWVWLFQEAQCTGAAAVTVQAESISSQFALSAEYAGRGRTDAQYVGDLYNAFLRRGGDVDGALYWIHAIEQGVPREQVRQAFAASPEFQGRVQAIIAQGCVTVP